MSDYYLHGTSIQNAWNIKIKGYKPKIKNWSISDPSFCYTMSLSNDPYQFSQLFLQGISPSILHTSNKIFQPAIVIIQPTDNNTVVPDQTGTFQLQHYNPTQISNVQSHNIKGIIGIQQNLIEYKRRIRHFYYNRLKDHKYANINYTIDDPSYNPEPFSANSFFVNPIWIWTSDNNICESIQLPDKVYL